MTTEECVGTTLNPTAGKNDWAVSLLNPKGASMKLSIVLLVLLVAGCGKHKAEDIDLKPGESASLEFRIPVVGDCSADGGKTWFSARKDGACYMADSDKAMSGEVALQLQTLKEENAKLKAEIAYFRHLEELSRNTSGSTISIHDSSGFFCRVHPDEEITGVVGICDEKRAAEDAKRP